MQIDRSNYEIWFIDWLDGNLNTFQVEQLKFFLSENPDIKEEFNDLTSINFAPTNILYSNKEHLKKSFSDIPQSQFEYLCAAYLENDTSDSQNKELMEVINSYPDRKKTFDLMLKTRLTPARISYKHKNLLRKQTVVQKVIRFSIIGLSTAAAIVLVIITYSVLPGNTSLKTDQSAQNYVADSTLLKSTTPEIAADRIVTDSTSIHAEPKREKRSSGLHKLNPVITNSDLAIAVSDDSVVRKTDKRDISINKVPVNAHVDLNKDLPASTLVASNTTIYVPDDERSKLGRFISRTFREKLLKEKTPPDSPLKGYEIAEAGVSGLNKLFGWEMALDKKNDENGQLKSVYFSSKILKFNAPIKKSEPLP
jgi:hypothetical protein